MRSLAWLLLTTVLATAQDVSSPRDFFGFEPGEDRKLLDWKELCRYCRHVAEQSDRVRWEVLGKTTEGRDLVMLVVSELSEERLAEVAAVQRRLARGELSAAELQTALTGQPAIVYVQATLHSTEIGAACMVPHLVHRLATADDEVSRKIRENLVVLVVPSANPDGQDLVVDWYRKTLDTPWEGSSPSDLYHRYAGHDDNRDWFMLSLNETRRLSRVLYEAWLPEVVLDIHQMGGRGARMFVPPYTDPLNPNVPSVVSRLTDLVGTHMALALSRAGKTGVMQDVTFDNWWHGGARSVPARHNMVGILTETAGARLASPVFHTLRDLRGHGRGLPEYQRRGGLPDPWPGGWWRLRDIVDYQLISSLALLEFSARYRRLLIQNFHDEAQRQKTLGLKEAPYGYELPVNQRDRGALARLVDNLLLTGVRVHRLGAGGPDDRFVISASQAFRPHLKDLLEPQRYPVLRTEAGGKVIRPYDAAGWTLPFQFGVECRPIARPLDVGKLGTPVTWPVDVTRRITGDSATLRLAPTSNAAYAAVNRLLAQGAGVWRDERGGFVVEASVLRGLEGGLNLDATPGPATTRGLAPVRRPRVGLLLPYPPSMDAGWTRLVLEEHGFEPRLLRFADLKSRPIADLCDTLVLPDVSSRGLARGAGADRLPPAFQGGLGVEGARALRAFVRGGGQVLCFNRSAAYAADVLGLPVTCAAPKLAKDQELVCPGSLLRALVLPGADTSNGLPAEVCVYVSGPRIIVPKKGHESGVQRVLNYPTSDLLQSGYLKGGEQLAGHCLMAVVPCGPRGRAVLYAFRPQHRSQTLGTFRLIFNAIYR